ncbi:MAG TPA: cell division protein ZapA [Blastocatellia bacterium]|nr:cell division protein ZapA [Blastocatellia bacterium]
MGTEGDRRNMELQGQSVNVRIYNQTYAIRASDGNVERTLQLAAMVDERMREIAKSALTSDSLKLAILAALHIADELDKANTKYEDLNQTLLTRSNEYAAMLDQLLK